MEELIENWEKRMNAYRLEADTVKSHVQSIKAMHNFMMLRDCVRELKQQLTLGGVGNCKRDETLKLLEEIMTKLKEANEEVENGIYDPMLECAKHIFNNYKIERR